MSGLSGTASPSDSSTKPPATLSAGGADAIAARRAQRLWMSNNFSAKAQISNSSFESLFARTCVIFWVQMSRSIRPINRDTQHQNVLIRR